MNKYTLSKPQKMLIGCAVVIAVFGFLAIIALGVLISRPDPGKPITISYGNPGPTDSNGQQLAEAIQYNQIIIQQSGQSLLQFSNNNLLLLGGSSLSINAEKLITATSGIIYLDIRQNALLNFNGSNLQLSSVQALYDVAKQEIVVLAGTISTGIEAATSNSIIFVAGQKLGVKDFDRSALNETPWPDVLATLASRNLLPVNLQDIEPPPLSNITPTNGTILDQETLQITGTSESGVEITLDGKIVATVTDSSFEIDYTLKPGLNSLQLTARDGAGNTTTQTLVYTYKPAQSPGSQAADCSFTNFDTQMLCLINNYRQGSGLTLLELSPALTTAASNHSTWMAENNTLDHGGANGTQPWDRCEAAGTTCVAENIAFEAGQSQAEVFIELWQQSQTHNENLLGDYGQIGIGNVNGYVTAVFR